MAETINNKPTIQIRSGLPSPLPDKSPSPATKLLISHGKPNFTISKKEENGNGVSPQPNANNNYNPYKTANSNASNVNSNKFIVGTKFNGVFKPSNVVANGNANASSEAENEAAKVVLRRPKLANSPPPAEDEDENVPEFIRRQRRIQERLAKENVLDFENRRSGYFTHVMISPDSPNRTSFVETMASPAIVPALEIPAPVQEKVQEEKEEQQEQVAAPVAPVAAVVTSALITEPEPVPEVTQNGHSEAVTSEVAPEEVAEAIEQVNQAVAGEEDEKPEVEVQPVAEVLPEPKAAPAPVEAQVEVVEPVQNGHEEAPITPTANGQTEEAAPVQNGEKEEAAPVQNGQKEETSPVENGHKEEPVPVQNGEAKVEETITISHTNGQTNDGPSIPAPDPSGALGVNYEPKTVVSFSQELGGGENNYPDTVKVVTEAPAEGGADGELKELTKLKFDIKSDEQNEVQVTPVLRAE
ncbi:hypothetical protein KR018_000202 [Drosophila ironensis]|nr:hypothetical protein KR018_000202 [Drosophila ironensis]